MSEPQRTAPLSVAIGAIGSLRSAIFPAIAIAFSGIGGSGRFAIALGVGIAAAVIGGTSLFGGSGQVVSALYGALVITAIQNGMDLLGMASGTKFVITGIVLLLAVLIDSLSKQRRSARGLA